LKQVLDAANDVNHLWLLLSIHQIVCLTAVEIVTQGENGNGSQKIIIKTPILTELNDSVSWKITGKDQKGNLWTFGGDTQVSRFWALHNPATHPQIEKLYFAHENGKPSELSILPASQKYVREHLREKTAQIKDANGEVPSWLQTRLNRKNNKRRVTT